MALKVVSSRPATSGLKVVSNPNGVGASTYNPQQTYNPQVTYNPQGNNYNPQQTYNPQRAATGQQLAGVTPAQLRAAAIRQQQEADRARVEAAIRKQKLIDAKNTEIGNRKAGFMGKLLDKISLGKLRRERSGREKAAKYYQDNELEWGSQIMARQRNYENRGAQLKDWVMQSPNEAEYNRRVGEANKWLESEYKSISGDISSFTKTQKQLSTYSQTPLSGKLPAIARTTKNVVSGVAGTSWNALTWTTSQPQRAVNTAKNFVNPNNLRLYYGGKEKQGGLNGRGKNAFAASVDQLKKAYSASAQQRLVGFSKKDETARLKGWKKTVMVDGKPRTITRTPSGIDRFRVKYGDDVVDMMLDPMSWLSGAGAASKVGKAKKLDRFMAAMGKNKRFRNTAISIAATQQRFMNSKAGRGVSWLNAEHKPRNIQARETVDALGQKLRDTTHQFNRDRGELYNSFTKQFLQQNRKKSDFLIRQGAHQKQLETRQGVFRKNAERLADDYVKRLDNFSDREVRAITKYARNGGKWSTYDRTTLSKAKRDDLTKFLDDYQVKARTLAKSEGLQRRAQNYLPEFTGRGYDPTKRRSVFGDKYFGQTRGQLKESLIMREFASNWDESNQYLKELSAIEKSILRNAGKTNRRLTEFEQQRLATIAQRKSQLTKVRRKYGRNVDNIRGAMSQVRQDAQPAFRINRRGIQTNFTKKGFKNTAADIGHAPMRVWKKAVLKYNPAWYVNNMMWNIPASVSAAGGGVAKEYFKLATNRKYWNEARKAAPEGVVSKISREVGKAGLASNLEDWSRLATFRTLQRKGFGDDQASKQVNRWLFDYTTKNIERPIKGVLPFWQWQKNLIRLGGTMPFHSPRSAKVYSELYKGLYQRPYDALPHETQSYTDPDTGKQVTYDPRKFYKGKAKIGNNWYGLPFFAVNPETMLNFGVNPYMMAAADYLTSSDRLGNSNTDRKAWTILGERFPQANLARGFANRDNKDENLWFAESGSSKKKQGFDKSKPNYDKNLDNQRKFGNTLKSFFGIPRGVKFDKKEFDTKKRLTNFNRDFFAVNWDDRLAKLQDEAGDTYYGFDDPRSPYNRVQAEQKALAKKYGFDLQKDIYDKYWSKYDTETTRNTKRLKKQAYEFSRGFWRDYLSLPAGSKTQASRRRPFLIGKFDEWKRNHTFANNVYYKIPEFSQYDSSGNKTGVKAPKNPFTLKREETSSQARRAAGAAKYARKLAYEKAKRTGDWSEFTSKYGNRRKSSPFRFDGKYFKTQQSMERYITGQKKYAKAKLWAEYFKLGSKVEKQAWLDKHPDLRTYKQPQTQAEWDALRVLLRAKNREKISQLPNFAASRARVMADIKDRVARFQPTAKQKAIRYKP